MQRIHPARSAYSFALSLTGGNKPIPVAHGRGQSDHVPAQQEAFLNSRLTVSVPPTPFSNSPPGRRDARAVRTSSRDPKLGPAIRVTSVRSIAVVLAIVGISIDGTILYAVQDGPADGFAADLCDVPLDESVWRRARADDENHGARQMPKDLSIG